MMKKTLSSLCAVAAVCCAALTGFGATETVDGVTYTYTVSGSPEVATITGVTVGSVTEVVIPSTLGGYPVTALGVSAFDTDKNDTGYITSVVIPEGVTEIGMWAFYYCVYLQSVTIPSGVTTIGTAAFKECALKSVTIPSSVTTIGDSAFSGCDALQSVTIPSSVTTIGNSAFRECESLQSVTIPSSVTTIGNSAFRACRALTSVTVPSSVTTIGEWAFGGCSSLESVCFDGNAPVCGDWVFEDVLSGCTAYVKKSSTGWGVTIPGTWNGIAIDYCPDAAVTLFDPFAPGAISEKGATYNGFLGEESLGGTFTLAVKKPKSGTSAATLTKVDPASGKKVKVKGTVNAATGVCGGALAGLQLNATLVDAGSAATPAGGTYRVTLEEGEVLASVPAAIAQTPLETRAAFDGKKFDAGKAAKVTYKKGVLEVNTEKGGNVSGLKLAYSKGALKGGFTVYAVSGGKLVKNKFKVTGVMIDGIGYAVGTNKKLKAIPLVLAK